MERFRDLIMTSLLRIVPIELFMKRKRKKSKTFTTYYWVRRWKVRFLFLLNLKLFRASIDADSYKDKQEQEIV